MFFGNDFSQWLVSICVVEMEEKSSTEILDQINWNYPSKDIDFVIYMVLLFTAITCLSGISDIFLQFF